MNLIVDKLEVSDVLAVSQLIERSFDDSVALTLSDKGIRTFKSGLSVESLKKRLNSENLFMVCRSKKEIIGVGEIRDKNHLNLLFVEPKLQKKGVGKKIFNELIRYIKASEVTVNSSLNAVNAYTQLGFSKNGLVSEVNGIRYQPMVYKQKRNT